MFGRLGLTLFVGLSLLGRGHVIAQDEPYAPIIDPANFVEGIDNPYFSLTPGTTFIHEGETEKGTEHIEVSVLSATRQILGITCTVVRDSVWVDGVLAEDTYDWYAQDRDGNVWYMGEETREYEDGVVSSTEGTWEAGVDGAQPGLVMEANPQVGDTYRQEYYAGEAEDMAEVISLTQSASVSYGAFDNLVVTREWTPLDPGVTEEKYYASGVGLILEVTVEGGDERIELVDITTRDAAVEDDADESEEMPTGTPLITAEAALQAAEAHLNNGTAREVELEYEAEGWIYRVEIGTDNVRVDAITGDVLGVDSGDD